MSSGSSSAHSPKPSQAIRSTTISVRVAGTARVRADTSGDLSPGRTVPRGALARAAASVLVELPLGPEDAERAEELPDGAVGVAARATPGELARPTLDQVEVVAMGRPSGEPRRHVRDRPQAEDTRPALG